MKMKQMIVSPEASEKFTIFHLMLVCAYKQIIYKNKPLNIYVEKSYVSSFTARSPSKIHTTYLFYKLLISSNL
jgi:hypothetical protein